MQTALSKVGLPTQDRPTSRTAMRLERALHHLSLQAASRLDEKLPRSLDWYCEQ